MARVHSSPSPSPPPPAAAAGSSSGKRVVFTVWMKSLVLNGHGCTVYDSGGRIVYRVDNYGSSSGDTVYLMDLAGKIVLKILRKKLAFGNKWEAYRWSEQKQQLEAKAWFTVARPWPWRSISIFQRRRRASSTCELWGSADGGAVVYKIGGDDDDDRRCCAGGAGSGKRACRIVDGGTGLVVAEARRKVTAGGVELGDDVLALTVEADVDHALVMGMVLVYGLMNHTI